MVIHLPLSRCGCERKFKEGSNPISCLCNATSQFYGLSEHVIQSIIYECSSRKGQVSGNGQLNG